MKQIIVIATLVLTMLAGQPVAMACVNSNCVQSCPTDNCD